MWQTIAAFIILFIAKTSGKTDWYNTLSQLKSIQNQYRCIWYSSKATWYPHACCSLKFLMWRLYHVFNIGTGAHYICARIRQIVRRVYPWILHLFWINFLMKLNINCIYMIKLRTLSLYVPIDPWIDSPTEKLLTCSCVVSHSLLFGVLSFCVENGSFIGDWISINLFTFGLSVGWKLVRKYASY